MPFLPENERWLSEAIVPAEPDSFLHEGYLSPSLPGKYPIESSQLFTGLQI